MVVANLEGEAVDSPVYINVSSDPAVDKPIEIVPIQRVVVVDQVVEVELVGVGMISLRRAG